MDVGIMGLAASGKSTVFGLLTGQNPVTGAAGHGDIRVGIARVPDPRLDALSAMSLSARRRPLYATLMSPGYPKSTAAKRRSTCPSCAPLTR